MRKAALSFELGAASLCLLEACKRSDCKRLKRQKRVAFALRFGYISKVGDFLTVHPFDFAQSKLCILRTRRGGLLVSRLAQFMPWGEIERCPEHKEAPA